MILLDAFVARVSEEFLEIPSIVLAGDGEATLLFALVTCCCRFALTLEGDACLRATLFFGITPRLSLLNTSCILRRVDFFSVSTCGSNAGARNSSAHDNAGSHSDCNLYKYILLFNNVCTGTVHFTFMFDYLQLITFDQLKENHRDIHANEKYHQILYKIVNRDSAFRNYKKKLLASLPKDRSQQVKIASQ